MINDGSEDKMKIINIFHTRKDDKFTIYYFFKNNVIKEAEELEKAKNIKKNISI